MQSQHVRDFMAKHYATITPEQSLASAVKKLIEHNQSAVPVIDEQQQLIGVLSEADCMRATLVEGYHNEGVALVKEQMTTDIQTISPDAELSAVCEIFLNKNLRMMPVVEAGNLVGVLTRSNILKALSNKL